MNSEKYSKPQSQTLRGQKNEQRGDRSSREQSKNPSKVKMYNWNVLGYQQHRQEQRQSMSTETRISIIYDSVVHQKTLIEMIAKYRYNYSTMRHLILQFHQNGKIDLRKFKQFTYCPGKAT